jgi:hypothetical protein
MHEISRFLGIVVRMHYRDHALPHFHASYGEFRVVVQIETGIVDGRFLPRAMRHLLEWTTLRQRELMEDWARAQSARPLEPVPPWNEGLG